MKFTEKLVISSHPEWQEYYLRYKKLNDIVYEIEAAESQPLGQRTLSPAPSGHLGRSLTREGSRRLSLDGFTAPPPVTVETLEEGFSAILNKDLQIASEFYPTKKAELLSKLEKTAASIRALETRGIPITASATTVETPLLHDGSHPLGSLLWSNASPEAKLQKEKHMDALQGLYSDLDSLIKYVQLEREGFRKILKKRDKCLPRLASQTDAFLAKVYAQLPAEHPDLQEAMKKVEELYARVAFHGDEVNAKEELRIFLQKDVRYERNTVWQDMVDQQRHVATLTVDGKYVWWQHTYQALMLPSAVLIFALLLVAPLQEWVSFINDDAQHSTAAMLVFVSFLWCSEALPLYVTSLLVPVLVVVLRLETDRDPKHPSPGPFHRLTPQEAAPKIFATMFSQVIMLLLGGFALAAALSRHFIDKSLASFILSKVGTKPRWVLLTNMLVAMFASMFISNVAAPVMCFSLIQPILRTLPEGNTFARALIMGIALASNLGGMTSPISSPQNIFAIQTMAQGSGGAPSWLQWFAVAIPVSLAGLTLCWLLLMWTYDPAKTTPEVRQLRAPQDPITKTQVYVVFITILTIGLWCANSWLSQWTGEMGIIAVLPLFAFFGFGVLKKEDFNTFLWHVVILAQGGSALGEAVKSSGLLQSIAEFTDAHVSQWGVWSVLAVFCLLILFATTFISHTVGAMVILPIIQAVGENMQEKHPNLLVMGAALMCSGAMGLPVSGFPNMQAIAQEDALGHAYVATRDFLRVGLLSSVFAYLLIISLGFALMTMIGW